MRTLLLGGGYLGSRVLSLWRGAGHGVTVLTRSADSAARYQAEGIEAVVGDVCEPSTLAFEGRFDAAVYCVGFDRSSGRGRREVAVGGVRNTLDALKGRVGRWVLTSTTSVYGQTGGVWVDEESETAPESENGQVAVEAETEMRRAGGTILRLAGLYGPGRTLAREAALAGEAAMPGRGDQWLNLVHVADAAAACVAAADPHADPWPPLVLTCDNEPVRRTDYYARLASLRGLPGPTFDGEAREGRGSSDKRCRNARLRSLRPPVVGPTYREGLADALNAADA